MKECRGFDGHIHAVYHRDVVYLSSHSLSEKAPQSFEHLLPKQCDLQVYKGLDRRLKYDGVCALDAGGFVVSHRIPCNIRVLVRKLCDVLEWHLKVLGVIRLR